jgi:glycosyltransferase involved in cell wall biosynthesis
MPSAFESLSIVIMESWLCGVPVLVNAKSEVLKEHCAISSGGRSFDSLQEFSDALYWFSDPKNGSKLEKMRVNGRKYVERNYGWDAVESKYLKIMDLVENCSRRLRVAFVVQRCGREVNGGAEALCLMVAQRMTTYWQTEVLTTCALDYVDWANNYPAGVDLVDSVLVRRFPVAKPRDIESFNRLSAELHSTQSSASIDAQEEWMRAQGPWSPELLDFIESRSDEYDAFIFFGYLYAQTWFGLPKVAEKAILAPLAHDEWTIHLNMWDRFFTLPRAFIFNTIEERDFLCRRFPSASPKGPVVGVAVDRPADIDPLRFRREYGVNESFLLYVGRIDPSKGCDELFDYFVRHRSAGLGPGKLVLLGKPVMPIPDHPDIVSLGFVSDQTKWDALAACDALIMPSPYESLSMVLLEAWSVGKPVLVNGRCEVLVGQCRRSNGGIWYENYEEFSQGLTCLQDGRNPGVLGIQGWRFVNERYSWQVIESEYFEAVNAFISPDVN